VTGLEFHRDEMIMPALSPAHYRANMEQTAGPVIKAVASLSEQPDRLAAFRAELDAVINLYFAQNRVRQSFLMTRALKR
jgi:hypothetical protein